MRGRVVLLSALAYAAAVTLVAQRANDPPQGPQATFRAGVDLIQLDVSVLDRGRHPVRGLTSGDFTLEEDGKARPIVAFSAVDLPARDAGSPTAAAWTREVAPDVATNQAPDEGRLVVIVMDRSIPPAVPARTARQIASAAIQALGPADLAAVVSTLPGVPQGLTNDRARLQRAVNQMGVGGAESTQSAEVFAVGAESILAATGVQLPVLGRLDDGQCFCGLCVLETITNIANAVRDVPGRRKVLLFIGASLALQASTPDCAFRLKDARAKLFDAVDRSGLTIHSIDPTGLEMVGPTSNAGSILRAPAAARGAVTAITESLNRLGELDVLPSRTGGRFVRNTNDPVRDVAPILGETESYYLLGFYPGAGLADGKFHKVEVKVKGRGFDVRSRKGYVSGTVGASSGATPATPPRASSNATPSPPALASQAARDALSGLLPRRDLQMRTTIVPVAIESALGARLAVAVEVPPPNPAIVLAPGRERLEVLTVAFDRRGQARASARDLHDVDWSGPARAPAELFTHLDLKPGDYEVRVAVAGGAPTRVGSVFATLVVPDFQRDLLAMSGVALALPQTRQAGEGAPPVAFASTRVFRRTDTPSAVLRVYQGLDRTEPVAPVAIRLRVVNTSDQLALDEASVLGPELFSKARFADCTIAVPLSQLVPGEYLLSVTTAVGFRTAAREIRFRVVP